MDLKAVILDLDNTLYDYDTVHKKSMGAVKNYCLENFQVSHSKFATSFKTARKQTHIILANTGSSHNRILYFQKFLESLNINSLEYSLKLYDLYWDTFLKEMKLFDDVEEVLKYLKSKSIKLCILTDLTSHIQFRKVKTLGLHNYMDIMITSEECGHEKPHPYMFYSALDKLNISKEEVFMIGDNWEKDILGANNLGIKAIWFNKTLETKSEIDNKMLHMATTFKEIIKIIQ